MPKTTKQQRRPKGEGSITVLPNGKYKMTITIGTGIDGKQKRRSVTATTKAELLKRVAELRIATGKTNTQDTIREMYFKELVDMYLKEKEETVSYNTMLGYKTVIKTLYAPLFDYKVKEITGVMIDAILDKQQRDKGWKDSSITEKKAKYASIFNWAVEHGVIDVSPVKRTRKRKKQERKADVTTLPTKEQVFALLKEAKDKKPNLYPLFLLAVSTGMRLGELLGLRRKNINMENHTIDISSQRTYAGVCEKLKTPSSYRIIYVDRNVLETVVTSAVAGTGDYFIFDERVHLRTWVDNITHFLRQSDNVPKDFTFHSFRHYHATQLLLNGIDVKAVSKRLGHSSVKTTLDLYAHWVPEMDERASQVIGSEYCVG